LNFVESFAVCYSGAIMRKTWKEVGLGTLSLLAIILIIVATHPVLPHLPHMVGGILLALSLLATFIACAKWIERRTPSELDLHHFLPEMAIGLVIGFGLFALSMTTLWAIGVYHPAGAGTTYGLARGLVAALVAGVLEEIVFRGLLFRLSSKILGTWGALLFTAALFGAAHAFNRGATVGSSLAIAIEAGILLGAAYAATERLWLPMGLHIGWNFTEGSIFSMSVSGNSLSGGLIQGSLSGPRILAGGQFGPEASIVGDHLPAGFAVLHPPHYHLAPGSAASMEERAAVRSCCCRDIGLNIRGRLIVITLLACRNRHSEPILRRR
jgi:hypothetical protein